MTLVVGKMVDGEMVLLADTKLTLVSGEQNNPYIDGCVKIYKVSSGVAVAFAGTREHFEDDLFHIMNCSSSEDIANLVVQSQMEGKDYDLLIAEIGKESLTFVRDGEIVESLFSYIGDVDGYNRFREYYLNVRQWNVNLCSAEFHCLQLPESFDELKGRELDNLFNSLEKTCLDSEIESVSGLVVPMCSDSCIFKYTPYMSGVTSLDKILNFSGEHNITVGSAESGSCNIEFMGKTVENRFALGVYFFQGKFGVCFMPNDKGLMVGRCLRCETAADWTLETKKILGEGMISAFLDEWDCLVTGERLGGQGEWDAAAYCYSLRADLTNLIDENPEAADRFLCGYCMCLHNLSRTEDAINMLNRWLPKLLITNLCDRFVAILKEKKCIQ